MNHTKSVMFLLFIIAGAVSSCFGEDICKNLNNLESLATDSCHVQRKEDKAMLDKICQEMLGKNYEWKLRVNYQSGITGMCLHKGEKEEVAYELRSPYYSCLDLITCKLPKKGGK